MLVEEEEKFQKNEDSRLKDKEECGDPVNQMVIYQNKDLELEGIEDLEEAQEGEILEEISGQLNEFESLEESQNEDFHTLLRPLCQDFLILENVLESNCMDLITDKKESKQKQGQRKKIEKKI